MRASGFSLLLVGARERWFGKGVTANAIARGTPSGRAVRLFIVWEAQLSESSFGLLADPLTEGMDSHKYLCTDIISHDVVVALSSSRTGPDREVCQPEPVCALPVSAHTHKTVTTDLGCPDLRVN